MNFQIRKTKKSVSINFFYPFEKPVPFESKYPG
jgi:hypothetical protein